MITRKFTFLLAMAFALTIAVSTSTYASKVKVQSAAKIGTYTPAKGSEDRKAIMDALRVVIRKMSGLEVIFVVRHLKINEGWAWVETDPESADGKNHYEPMVGLLHKKTGVGPILKDRLNLPFAKKIPIVSTLPAISKNWYGNTLLPRRIFFPNPDSQVNK